MTIAARPRPLMLAVLCAVLCAVLAMPAAPAADADAAVPKAAVAKKKRGKKRATKRDLDGDGIPNSRDRDIDGDGKPNGRDRDIDGDGKPNKRDRDMDGDGIPNKRDRDMDGDGIPNISDSDPDADGRPGIAPGVLPPPPPPVKQPRGFFGLVSDDTVAGNGTSLAATGVGTVRLVFSWSSVERTPGVFDFADLDREVKAAAEHGISILPLLAHAPSFRSTAPPEGAVRGLYPPRSNADFAAFAAAAARRYAAGGSFWQSHPSLPARPIRAWQVWNEPNIDYYWRPRPDAAQYVAMLRAVGGAVKGVDPSAEIVTAGLPDSRIGVALAKYVDEMYRAGGRDAFDTLAVHPYAVHPEGVSENLAAARAILDRHGDREAGLRATEFGWATGGGVAGLNVGEQGQATLIGQTLQRLAGESARLRLRGVLYFSFRDSPLLAGGRDYWGLHSGLIASDGRPKPALRTFADAVRALSAE